MYPRPSVCADTDTDVSVRYAPHTQMQRNSFCDLGPWAWDDRTWYSQAPAPLHPADGPITFVAPSSAGIVCIFKVDLPALHMYLYLALASSAEFRLLRCETGYISISHVV